MELWKKRLLVFLTAGMILSGPLFARGGSESPAGETVLELPSYQAQEQGFSDWWNLCIQKFESKNPGVKVRLIPSTGHGPHHQNLQTRFAAGNAPDLIHLSFRFYFRFADEGWLEPLDDYIKTTDIRETWSPILGQIAHNGRTFCIPLLGYAYGLFYNKGMFDAAGVAVPKNLEELVAAAEKLTRDTTGSGRTNQFGWDLFVAEDSSACIAATWMLISNGTHWTDSSGKLKITSDPLVEKTLEQWRTVVKRGWTPIGLSDIASRQHFMAGNAAMLIDGSWVTAMIAQAPPEVAGNVRIARVPFSYIPTGPSNVIGMPSKLSPERKKLAWEFIKSLTTPESQEAYTSLTGSPAPRKGAVTPEFIAKSPGMQIFNDAQFQADANILPAGYEVEFAEFSDAVVKGLMLLASTDTPTRTILAQMEQDILKIKQ